MEDRADRVPLERTDAVAPGDGAGPALHDGIGLGAHAQGGADDSRADRTGARPGWRTRCGSGRCRRPRRRGPSPGWSWMGVFNNIFTELAKTAGQDGQVMIDASDTEVIVKFIAKSYKKRLEKEPGISGRCYKKLA